MPVPLPKPIAGLGAVCCVCAGAPAGEVLSDCSAAVQTLMESPLHTAARNARLIFI
jgi:hypothetical protein